MTAHHNAFSETVFRAARSDPETKPFQLRKSQRSKERKMRTLIFGAVLIAVASVGFHVLISGSLAAAREAKAATFSERFAPVLKSDPGT
jgi:hypothetical protein